MKARTLSLLLLLSSVSLGAASARAWSVADEVILREIAHVETGNNPNAPVGSRGERTQYQFLPATWKRYSKLPFASARHNPAEVSRVAHAHLADIRARLKARGIAATPYNIAVAWNAGANWRRIPASTRNYAQRVSNLVEEAAKTGAHPNSAPRLAKVERRTIVFSVSVPIDSTSPAVAFPLAGGVPITRLHVSNDPLDHNEVRFIPSFVTLLASAGY